MSLSQVFDKTASKINKTQSESVRTSNNDDKSKNPNDLNNLSKPGVQ